MSFLGKLLFKVKTAVKGSGSHKIDTQNQTIETASSIENKQFEVSKNLQNESPEISSKPSPALRQQGIKGYQRVIAAISGNGVESANHQKMHVKGNHRKTQGSAAFRASASGRHGNKFQKVWISALVAVVVAIGVAGGAYAAPDSSYVSITQQTIVKNDDGSYTRTLAFTVAADIPEADAADGEHAAFDFGNITHIHESRYLHLQRARASALGGGSYTCCWHALLRRQLRTHGECSRQRSR